jgi:proteasome accessory factor B
MPAPDAAERLLNLVIALSHARVRMTRSEIRATVAGYDPGDDKDDADAARRRTAAFERMFERDKEDLRRLGIPLRTVTDATHGDDIGYVIDVDDAAMPPISLTPVERAVLAVAAEYWQNAALGTDARRALIKVASSTGRIEDVPLHLSARSTQGADAAPVLAQAIADGQAVQFAYTSAASGKAVRTVEPWRLVVRGGPLYLVGLDRDRGASRTYRLSRIEGPVRAVGERGVFVAPSGRGGVELEESVPTLTARIGLKAESGHSFRRRGVFIATRGSWDVFDVPYSDTEALRDEILSLAGAARVVSPATLAAAIVEHAKKALEVSRG